MKFNKFYKQDDTYDIYYFKFKLIKTEVILYINTTAKIVDITSYGELFADKEVTDIEELNVLEDLVWEYFANLHKYHNQMSTRYENLSKNIYHE